MEFKINNVSNLLIELKVTGDIESGVMDAREAKELAVKLLDAANELLCVEDKK